MGFKERGEGKDLREGGGRPTLPFALNPPSSSVLVYNQNRQLILTMPMPMPMPPC